ncbi:M16 family metallopeptidase [Clostridium tarantellae]|uniref:Insulinase family protein n=1 Tax=Clostridium tarantellae TaxID=39493 RepID=A0A6I1MFN9_9CLOT|nr:pitrilysin family protein [Clostridium tarantellae]MPQ42326.1 insulinase family protein [Clostridium tarantellae]
MKKYVLENGVRFLYKFREGKHTSFTIALEAGANSEEKNIGCAHALEHMLFKGSKNLTEQKINSKLDELFGFNNAMTNFPYVIYYGTTSNEDFKEGFNLYSDIVLKPTLNSNGFIEEMNVIKQESIEWKEDLEQYCEDLLLLNGFKKERLEQIIIGNVDELEKITLHHIKEFYKKFYIANNMVISITTSLDFDYVKQIVLNNFKDINRGVLNLVEIKRELNESKTFINDIQGIEGAKIAVAFDIQNLSLRELWILKIFNLWFGEGVSSLLFDEIRTKKGLAYEVYSEVKGEKGINLFKISLSTNKEDINESLNIINECIEKAKNLYLNEKDLKTLEKRFNLKTSLELERSIVVANRTAIYELMYNDGSYVFKEMDNRNCTIEEMREVVNKVLNNAIIQILK